MTKPAATPDPRFAGWLAGASWAQADRFAQDMAGRGPQQLKSEGLTAQKPGPTHGGFE